MSTNEPKKGLSRRSFVASTAASAILAGFSWKTRPSLAHALPRQQAAPDAAVAKVRIYPAIGISRVGGSNEWFYAPEVPGLAPDPGDSFKDSQGKIKKQVQRFRIYSFDANDNVIGEVTEGITWQVQVANTKAAWYGFNNPMDNGELAPGMPSRKRNQYFVREEQRNEMLIIDGGVKNVSGPNQNPNGEDESLHFVGQFWGYSPVGLGQLRTDDQGRLMVVPPDGVSSSPAGAGITSFADNDGWHDDWCDGPVTATVEIPGLGTVDAEPAWIACVGPNFAPEIPPVTTLYDCIQNMNVEQGWTQRQHVGQLSFVNDIYPIFRRLALMDWVANEANLRVGWLPGVGDFNDPEYIERLADRSVANETFRQDLFQLFRNPHNLSENAYIEERLKMPYMLGDGVNYDGSPLQWFQFTYLQYQYLKEWAAGSFINDYSYSVDLPSSIDDLALEDQPMALTQAALEPCSGGAFHPGVELTYYLRLPAMYARDTDPMAEPFRLAHGNRYPLTQDMGRLLTPELTLHGNDGVKPIGPQSAGDLTRWMGLPWQCDAFSCQQVLMQENYPTAVWWPALLPINVLPEAYYENALNTEFSEEERTKFMNSREAWSRGVAGIGYHANGSYWDGITNMIKLWERMGFVVRKPHPINAAMEDVFVEVDRGESMENRFDWKPSDGMLPN